ncbi:MAG: hypothetical protein KDD62_15790, partial [Bdellovibrionales bacterium]|nr:hypothetical protein [Bdellovibrionales bacterium]
MGIFLRYSGPNREHIDQEPALFAAKQFVELVDNHAPKLQSLVTKVIDDELYSLSNLRYLGYLTQVLSQFTRSDSYLPLDHFQDLACCCQPNQFYMEKITQGLSAAFSHEGCDAMVTRIEGGL